MDRLTDYIKVYDNVLTETECKDYIELFNSSQSQTYDTPGYKFDQLNLNEAGVHGAAQGFIKKCLPSIQSYIISVNKKEFIPFNGFEQVRIKKYTVGTNQRFDTHVDVLDHASARRSLVFMLYLNDNDGCTYFPGLDYTVTPKAGRLLVFPPLWLYPHGGQEPTNHDKYIIMSCVHYA